MLNARESLDGCPKDLRYSESKNKVKTRPEQLIRDHAPALEGLTSGRILKVLKPRREEGSYYVNKVEKFQNDHHLFVNSTFIVFSELLLL